jgi:hypothetical protein
MTKEIEMTTINELTIEVLLRLEHLLFEQNTIGASVLMMHAVEYIQNNE